MSQSSVALFELSRQALRTTQVGLGELLGVSRRTAQRWATSGVPSYEMRRLAELVHPVNPNLAMQIASSLGTTLETLGIVKPVPLEAAPPPRPSLPPGVVDAVVCAAAEVIELMPKDVRPALHAAFARAAEVGLTVEEVERALRAKLEPKQAPAMASVAGPRRSRK